MLFNSFEFIIGFLPITLIIYFFLQNAGLYRLGKVWILIASLFFYSWWKIEYLPIIIASVIFNYYLGKSIAQSKNSLLRKNLLIVGVLCNVSTIAYFKYADFFIENVNLAFSADLALLHLALPLGISFFTFQQIAYLVDSYKGATSEYDFVNYGVFVTFFPQLIAGPIVHHEEMMPQFKDKASFHVNYFNLSKGLFIFLMGLCKKVVVADTFSIIANLGYANTALLNNWESWVTSIAYSIQLYFDFSGYSDMAIGLGLMFNINIPLNFNSPYKARNIQDFWRRWHMTLSRFLRDYIYIPLGGNKSTELNVYRNLLLTFIIGGIWHGAGWTFILWGFLHGMALVIHRIYKKTNFNMPSYLAISITFLFVNMAWVFFRAETWTDAITLLKKMTYIETSSSSSFVLINDFYSLHVWIIGIVLLFAKNTNQRAESFKPDLKHAILIVLLGLAGIIYLNSTVNQDFLYFDF